MTTTQQAAHTLERWHIGGFDTRERQFWIMYEADVDGGIESGSVGLVDAHGGYGSKAEARARLIAAAPAMFEALKMASGVCDDLMGEACGHGVVQDWGAVNDFLCKARAALSLAQPTVWEKKCEVCLKIYNSPQMFQDHGNKCKDCCEIKKAITLAQPKGGA